MVSLDVQANLSENSPFLSAQMAVLRSLLQMFIVLGMYNFGHRTKKCIHSEARCDLHPHPACVYKNEEGEKVAEDEEHCKEEYINKGLVPRTVNMECISPIHNMDSPAMKNHLYNLTEYEKRDFWNWFTQPQVIPKGTITQTLATKCDGHQECWQGLDEVDCDDLDPGTTVLIGTYFNSFYICVDS